MYSTIIGRTAQKLAQTAKVSMKGIRDACAKLLFLNAAGVGGLLDSSFRFWRMAVRILPGDDYPGGDEIALR